MEVATWQGLVTPYVLVVIALSTRRVASAGITPHPNAACIQQCPRQLTDHFHGFLLGKRDRLHDRDSTCTDAFDHLWRDSGIEPVMLPPRGPHLHAHCERCVRSITEEALDRMVLLGERALSCALQRYLIHAHTERNHQGLDNQLITREGDGTGAATVPSDQQHKSG